jgi:hypothetical protein
MPVHWCEMVSPGIINQGESRGFHHLMLLYLHLWCKATNISLLVLSYPLVECRY